MAVSPDGGRVFVTGRSATSWDRYNGGDMNFDYLTVAYGAPNGTQLWAKRYNGPGHFDDHASAVAVSPGGGTVFVTGFSEGGSSAGATGQDYATIAYSG